LLPSYCFVLDTSGQVALEATEPLDRKRERLSAKVERGLLVAVERHGRIEAHEDSLVLDQPDVFNDARKLLAVEEKLEFARIGVPCAAQNIAAGDCFARDVDKVVLKAAKGALAVAHADKQLAVKHAPRRGPSHLTPTMFTLDSLGF